jgi:hypothetical protein
VREANGATKELHGAIAKLGKALERAFDLGADAGRALTPAPEAEAGEQAAATLTAVLHHLLREGEPEAARALAAEAGVPLPDALAAPFAAVHAVLARLRARDLAPALAWAAEHRAALAEGGAGARLELRLHSLGFVAALRSSPTGGGGAGGGAPAALAYARAHLGPFHAAFPRETQRLMGALLFAGRPPGPYADLFDDARWGEAGHELSRLACRLMGQAYESPLAVAVAAGAVALPPLLKVAAVMERAGQLVGGLRALGQLPIELELGPQFVFRSIFACPVSKDPATPDNPAALLPCGHMLCQQSVLKIARGRSKILKCPYCPTEARVDNLRTLVFPDPET